MINATCGKALSHSLYSGLAFRTLPGATTFSLPEHSALLAIAVYELC